MLRNASTPLAAVQQCLRTSSLLPDTRRSVSTDTVSTKPRSLPPGFPKRERKGKQPDLSATPGPKSPKATRTYVPRTSRPSANGSEDFSATPGSKFPKATRTYLPRTSRPNANALEKPLLRPYDVSIRLQKLCEKGQLDEAVSQLQNLPLDALNTPVWNMMIQQAIRASKLKLAYQLYIDMKRRGFSPTIKTFTTMFGSYQALEDWPKHTKQLGHVHTLFENYKQYVEQVKEQDPNSPELAIAPVGAYIKILGDAGLYQKMFDVYYAMDEEGPLAANQYTFTAMVRAIMQRKASTNAPAAVAAMRAQNASDVKLIWRRMVKLAEKNPRLEIDSHVVGGTIAALALGRPADQLFAFDIVREFLGLTKPGETPLPARLPMSEHLLAEVLWLCNVSQKYRLGIHFFRQVADQSLKPGGVSVINRQHVENVLRLYAGLTMKGTGQESTQALETLEWSLREAAASKSGRKLTPTLSTFTLVLGACWRGGDWASAIRTFELMTGYSADDFKDRDDARSRPIPRMEERSEGRNIMPDTTAMSHMVRTALTSRDRGNMRQCLRIVDHLDAGSLLSPEHRGNGAYRAPALDVQNPAFFTAKLAKDLVVLIDEVVLNKNQGSFEENRWMAIRTLAKQSLRQIPAVVTTPFTEEFPLGSHRGLAATESVVDNELTRRALKSAR